MKALQTALSGMVGSASIGQALDDAARKNTQTGDDKVPHTTDPIVAIAAKAGLGLAAGQGIALASGEAISVQSGRDTNLAVGAQMRLHTGQSIGVLAGAVQAGAGSGAKGTGLTMINGLGPIDVQAQAGKMQVAAKDLINIQSAHGDIDWAAAKRIVLSTFQGAEIDISAAGVVPKCPGKITIRAEQKSFIGPERVNYVMPVMPHADHSWVKFEGHYDDAWNTGWLLDQVKVDVNQATVHQAISIETKRKGS